MSIPQWKTDLIELALKADILGFGSFTLKSGRTSPYFVNCGRFSNGRSAKAIADAYARTVEDYGRANKDFGFDVIFGPAYKGIPIAATTTYALQLQDEKRWGDVGYSFNRKEAKDHGEGGTIVGESMKGKRVVIIDDVITAGTAIREAIDIIKAQGGTLAGIVVAIDRQEKMPSQGEKEGKGDDGSARGSAIGEVRRETGVPVLAVLTLDDIVEAVKKLGMHEEVKQMQNYRSRYGASD
ncbi:hypothetical protein AC579_3322 [Pseudocercospora musae]|uniref:Orotate phosphoribosyltransferase n=1 Tax=Pseudocercospora musae TaxID=113226 RepID=A0A139H2P8_9PEZI|nr:hypothetical protein AC579_3322 [Pseudocercospora musae]